MTTNIDIGLLIASPTLQDALVDKTGQPLAGGIVTFYKSDQVTLKNWYYQTFANAQYSYIAGPNPLTLSGAGTFVDTNGNDIIPFFYPYDETNSNIHEPYFVQVEDSNLTLQFTRENFPFVAPTNTPANESATLENYLINNRFWRNPGVGIALNVGQLSSSWTLQYNNTGTYYYQTLCPSQHDGFSMPDINYIKDVNGNGSNVTDIITFQAFAKTTTPTLTNDIQPEYYMNYQCTNDTSGATLKVIQIPISLHLATLVAQGFTFTLQARCNSGNPIITMALYAFCGSGATSPLPTFLDTITLTGDWDKYTLNDSFPATEGLTLSSTNDDAYYLQIEMPVGQTDGITNIDLAIPSLYLSTLPSDLPSNSFATYDQIDTVICSPRTGDVRVSMNTFYPFGWIPMNDGLIGLTNPGNSTLYCRANADVWPLFNLLWQFGKTYDSGSNFNPLFQMYTNTAGVFAATNYGATAYADFVATSPAKTMRLPFMMGKVLMGTVPLSALLPATPGSIGYQSVVTASSSTGLLFTTSASNLLNLFQGGTVTFTGTAALVNVAANTVYYIVPVTSTTFKIATTFANALTSTVVSYTGAETGTVTANLQLTSSSTGQYAHTQLLTELVAHTHGPLAPATGFITSGAGAATLGGGAGVGISATTASTGGGLPFNVTQPGTFTNMYIKL